MIIKNSVFIIFCLKFYLAVSEKDLPPYFPKCYRDDPNLNECLLKATDQVRPFLQKGVPELNILPISPFFIPEINLQLGTDALSYKSTLANVTITGLDHYKFTKFEFDVKNLMFTGAVDMGFLNIKGKYSIQGKILSVPVEGNGLLNSNITSSNGTLTQQAKLVTRKGIKYLEAEKTIVKIDIGGDVQSDFSGLFDGNQILAKAAEDVIRENLKEIVNEIKPAIEEVFTRFSQDILFKSVSRIPFDVLYPVRHSKNT